jgi:cyanate permease
MIGPPLAGALIDLTGDYHCSAYVAVVGGIVSLAAIVPLREGRPPVESVAADLMNPTFAKTRER